jgi:hypothetical protein
VTDRLVIVVSLWLKNHDVAAFEACEHAAADLMAAHGGRIDSAIRCAADAGGPFEVHVVSFPSVAAYDAYRTDPRVLELRPLREQVVARTEVWRGTVVAAYGTARGR